MKKKNHSDSRYTGVQFGNSLIKLIYNIFFLLMRTSSPVLKKKEILLSSFHTPCRRAKFTIQSFSPRQIRRQQSANWLALTAWIIQIIAYEWMEMNALVSVGRRHKRRFIFTSFSSHSAFWFMLNHLAAIYFDIIHCCTPKMATRCPNGCIDNTKKITVRSKRGRVHSHSHVDQFGHEIKILHYDP